MARMAFDTIKGQLETLGIPDDKGQPAAAIFREKEDGTVVIDVMEGDNDDHNQTIKDLADMLTLNDFATFKAKQKAGIEALGMTMDEVRTAAQQIRDARGY